MHYPCDYAGDPQFRISAQDREDARKVYGKPFAEGGDGSGASDLSFNYYGA